MLKRRAALKRDAPIRPSCVPDGWHQDSTRGAARVYWVGRVMIITLTALLGILLLRVAQLQAAHSGPIANLIDSQKSNAQVLGRRGTLEDRQGRPLATTRVAGRLFADPGLIEDRSTFSERVAMVLDYDPVAIEKAIFKRPQSRYVVLDKRMSETHIDLWRDAEKIPGLATEPILVRDYPQGDLAGPLIGFVGAEGHGLEGMEAMFNKQLEPEPGRYRFLRDARRRPLWVDSTGYETHRNGQAIRLSIDAQIQAIAEQQLTEAVEKYNARSGQLVVMDPRTGEILAMASYPSYAPAEFSTTDPAIRRNRSVTDVFEPGSIFKPFIWSVATEAGIARPDEMIDCTDVGYWKPRRGPILRDAHPHGRVTWSRVLLESSNIGMAVVAERMGKQAVHDAVRRFGFGRTTDSGLPGEIEGLVRPIGKWSETATTRVPIGQGVAVTALQMTRAFCVFANGGELIQPTILPVDRFLGDLPPTERVLEPQVAELTRFVLRQAVTEGTGRKADSELYALFGKTGTAQLPNFEQGGYHQDRYVASFMAGAPYDEPRIVVGCFIHDPDRSIGHYGGTVAAPAVKNVIEQSLLYLGVPPLTYPDQQPEAQLAQLDD